MKEKTTIPPENHQKNSINTNNQIPYTRTSEHKAALEMKQSRKETETNNIFHHNKTHDWIEVTKRNSNKSQTKAGTEPKQSENKQEQKRKSSVIIGRGTIDNEFGLAAAEQLTFVHVSGAHPNLSVENMRNYVQNKVPVSAKENVHVSSLHTSGPYTSVKIGVPEEISNNLLTSEFWPNKMRVRPFQFHTFRKSKHTQRRGF